MKQYRNTKRKIELTGQRKTLGYACQTTEKKNTNDRLFWSNCNTDFKTIMKMKLLNMYIKLYILNILFSNSLYNDINSDKKKIA